MKKNTVYVTRHDLSSLFEKTISLIGPTWKASLPAVAIIYAPIAVLTSFFLMYYFRFLTGIMEIADAGSSPETLAKLFGFLGFFILYLVVAAVGSAFGECLVSRNAFKAATGEKSSWTGLFREVIAEKAGKIVVLTILQGLIFLGLALVFTLLVVVATVLFALEGAAAVIGGIILALGLIAFYLGIFIIAMLLPISYPILSNEEGGAVAALGRTFKLVKGNVWRIFGISLLFSIALSFAVGIASTPLQLAVSIPFLSNVQELTAAGDSDAMLRVLSSMMQSMLVPYMVITAITGIASMCISPLFRTLFYIDLRVRSGDLPDTAQFSELGVEPPAGV